MGNGLTRAIEEKNLHQVLANVSDLRKARIPEDLGELKRRIAHLEKMLAEAQDYQRRNEAALGIQEEEIKRASALSGSEGLQKLKRIMPKRDKSREMVGAWKAVAAEAADVLQKYRDALAQKTTSVVGLAITIPTRAQATMVATAKRPKRPMIPHFPFMH